MSTISAVFKKGPAYVGYITAGDGGMERSLQSMLALVAGGVDILEVGMPFSDPVADGPTIQAAAARSLSANTTLAMVLKLIADFRQHSNVPIIFFSYYNPIFAAMQNEDFFKQAREAGVDGLLVVDVPLEEVGEYYQQATDNAIDPILLLSPSTPVDRIKKIAAAGKGMLYYACRKGTTGVKNDLPADLTERLAQIKSQTQLPIAVGFGIADCERAEAVLQHADGFVVGSRFVQAIADGISPDELTLLAQSIDPREQ